MKKHYYLLPNGKRIKAITQYKLKPLELKK